MDGVLSIIRITVTIYQRYSGFNLNIWEIWHLQDAHNKYGFSVYNQFGSMLWLYWIIVKKMTGGKRKECREMTAVDGLISLPG